VSSQIFHEYSTARLRLRAPRNEDIDPFFEVSRDEDVMRFYGMKPFKAREQAAEEIGWFNDLFTENKGLRWIITEQGSDEYIGDIGFHKYEEKHRRAEIGYKLAKAYWNRGFMSEVIEAALRHGFIEMNLNRVEALVDPRNPSSLRVLEKQGFKREGLLREYDIEYGIPVDLVMLSLLKREWV
jgi:ribosomal-protein-alanine N-acetyltransferase